MALGEVVGDREWGYMLLLLQPLGPEVVGGATDAVRELCGIDGPVRWLDHPHHEDELGAEGLGPCGIYVGVLGGDVGRAPICVSERPQQCRAPVTDAISRRRPNRDVDRCIA